MNNSAFELKKEKVAVNNGGVEVDGHVVSNLHEIELAIHTVAPQTIICN